MAEITLQDDQVHAAESNEAVSIVRELRYNLQKVPPPDLQTGGWTLEQAITILQALRNTTERVMETPPVGVLGDAPICVEHASTQIISELVLALADIPKGVHAPQLRFPKTVLPAGRTHGTVENSIKRELLAAVNAKAEVLKQQGIKNNKAQARRDTAKAANEVGIVWDEKQKETPRKIDPKLLESWEKRR
jgi:hypothetical protein